MGQCKGQPADRSDAASAGIVRAYIVETWFAPAQSKFIDEQR